MYEGIFADVEKVKQILSSRGHMPVDETLMFELLEELGKVDRVVEVLLGSSLRKSNAADSNSDSFLRTDSSCGVSKLYSNFEEDISMNSSYSDEFRRVLSQSNNSISSYDVPFASISIDLTTDDIDESSHPKVVEFSKMEKANEFVVKTDPNHSAIEIKDATSQIVDLTKQPDTTVNEESCRDTDTDTDLVGINKHNETDVTSLVSDSDEEMDDYYEESLLESEESYGKHSPLPLLSPTVLRATSSPHFLNRIQDLSSPEPPLNRVDEILEENNNDPNNNLEDIQIMEQNNSSSPISADVVSKEDSHRAPCTFHSNFLKSVDQIHDNPKPGCSKDSYFDDVPAPFHTENASSKPIETVDMGSTESATTVKQLDTEVIGHSEKEIQVSPLETDAINIKKVLPDISLVAIKRSLKANKHAINRVALCLWDFLPNERPLAILSGKRTSKEDDCPVSLKKIYSPVEDRDEAGQFKEIGSTDDAKVDEIDTDNVFVCTSMNNETEKHGNINTMPIDNPTQKDVSSNSCLSNFSTAVTPLRTTRVEKGIVDYNEATAILNKITESEDFCDCDDDSNSKYKHPEDSSEGYTNEGQHETKNVATTSNESSIPNPTNQHVVSKVTLKPSKLNHIVGCTSYHAISKQPFESSQAPVSGSFKLNQWRSSVQEYSNETNNAEMQQNNISFDPLIYWPKDKSEKKRNLVHSNIVTDVDKPKQSSQLESVTRISKLKINIKPSSFCVSKDSGEMSRTTNHTKQLSASKSSEFIKKPAANIHAGISVADVERRNRDGKVATNAPIYDDWIRPIQGRGTRKHKDQNLIQPGKLKVRKSVELSNPVVNDALSIIKNRETTLQNNLGAIKKPPPKSATINAIPDRPIVNEFQNITKTVARLTVENKQIISETTTSLDEGVGSTTPNLSANLNTIPIIANNTMSRQKQNEEKIYIPPILNDQRIGAVINNPSTSSIELAATQNSTAAHIPATSHQTYESQVSSSSGKVRTMTVAIQQNSSTKIDPPRELFNPLINMFPDVNPKYITKLCIKAKKRKQVLEELVEHLLETGIQFPRTINPEPEPTLFTADEQYENLQGIFPDAHPEYLRDIAELHWDNPEVMKNFVEELLETQDYPTMAAYLEKVKITEQIRRYTVDFDVKNFLEIFPDPFAHFENPAREYKYNIFAFQFLKRHFTGIKVVTIQKVYSYRNNRYHISLSAKELESIGSDMKGKRSDKQVPIEDIPLLQEFAFISHKNEIRNYMNYEKMMDEQEFEELKNDKLLLQCQCCFDDECMPRKCFTCTEGHIFCKSCILLGTQTKIGEGHLEFPCFTTCSGEFTLEVLQKVVTPTAFSILLRKKQEAEVKAAGLEGLVSCPFCHFASIPPPEDRIFKCLNPDCMKETCRLCKELNHVPLQCDEVTKSEDARHYLEEKMTAALVRTCYRCSRTFFKDEGCNKMTCPCGASMCYICGEPVTDYKHFNAQGSNRVDLCPLWTDDKLMNAKAVRAVAEAAEKEIRTQNPNLKIDATALMPTLPKPVRGPHQDIPNAHILPVHAQNHGQANFLR